MSAWLQGKTIQPKIDEETRLSVWPPLLPIYWFDKPLPSTAIPVLKGRSSHSTQNTKLYLGSHKIVIRLYMYNKK